MLSPLPFNELSDLLADALAQNLFTTDDESIIFYDLSRLRSLMSQLVESFPGSTLHAVAIKANPLLAVLKEIQEFGLGAEAASLGELELAKCADFPGARVVFDSPVKTTAEIEAALVANVRLNADSLAEIERIATKIALRPQRGDQRRGHIGIRVNPQTATGATSYTVTAGKYSKFGVALSEKRTELREAFRRYSWLNTLHVHVGSQACSLDTLIDAIAAVVEFAGEVNAETNGQIVCLDIGGGLPTSYHRGESVPSFLEYRLALEERIPGLFDDRLSLVTEFGRHLHSSCGVVFSRVEAVKEQCGTRTAAIHVGADLLVRECYNPGDWHHDIAVFDSTGQLKTGPEVPQSIAGPLCFSGDVVARDRLLPIIEVGDFIAIADIGAYTFSMWSRYNSRQRPKIVGHRMRGSQITPNSVARDFAVIQEKETLATVVAAWS